MEMLSTLHKLDTRLFAAVFHRADKQSVRQIARAVSRSADGYLCVMVPALLWLFAADGATTLIVLLFWSLCLERTLYWLLKNGLRRRRPQEFLGDFRSAIVAADRFSLPSGHTSVAFLLTTALTVIYREPALAMYLWASAVALSRVVLGVHFPGDTLAGAFMGSAVVLSVAMSIGIL